MTLLKRPEMLTLQIRGIRSYSLGEDEDEDESTLRVANSD